MPGSKVTSTKVSVEFVVTEEEPATFDPALAARTLREMAELERKLFRSGLSAEQRALLGRLSDKKVVFWRMTPEGY